MKRFLAGACLALTAATGAQAATIFGVDENNNLVTFNSGAPGAFTSSVRITGVGLDESLQALDFRSSNGALYGLSAGRNLYRIDALTGVATQIGGTLAITGGQFGFDFNPVVDAIRIVSNDNTNYVVNPDTGAVTNATNVFYPAGDPNAGRDPGVTANAYLTNSAVQFAIDTDNDVLVRQANSMGTLTTVGPLSIPPSDIVGTRTSFDILGSDSFVQNGRNFYSVNLDTGLLSLVGRTNESLFGIAISPGAVPEPATWAMMLLGFGFVGYSARRRTRVRFAQAA